MLNLRIKLFDDSFDKHLKDYFKKGSSRPDFMKELPYKLQSEELKKRQNPEYLFGILYMLENTTDFGLRERLKNKLLEELVIQVVELNNDKGNLHDD